MRRREFNLLLGGAMAAWPLAGHAQQSDRKRRIGVLMTFAADDPEGKIRIAAFLQKLRDLDWTEDRDVRIDYRWTTGDADGLRRSATELVALAPDVLLAIGSSAAAALQQATSTLPIVFVNVIDPIGAGLVASLARPAGNSTGFTVFEYAISGKWLELLKEIAPRVRRAAIIQDATIAAGVGQWGVLQAAAPSSGIEVTPVDVRDAGVIESAVLALARSSSGGLIVTGSPSAGPRRELRRSASTCRPRCSPAPTR
jgi:putative tryptophan/tyrosine transport system substrate-binding protein